MTNRYQCGVWLSHTIGRNCHLYLPDDVKKLIFDWKILDELIEANQSELYFSDYSFVMAAMYKAVEGCLMKIAEDLGIDSPKQLLGNVFDENYLDKFHPKLDNSGLDKNKIIEIRHQLSELKTFLKRYRHNPAHYGSKFKSLSESRLASSSALHNLKCLIQDLLTNNLIEIPRNELKESHLPQSEEDDIPF